MLVPDCHGFDVDDVLACPPRVHQRVASYLLRYEQHEAARPLLEALAADQPEGILYRAWLGQCLLGLGRSDEAAAVIRALRAAHPESALAAAVTVDLLLAEDDRPGAFEACQELLRSSKAESALAWEKLAAYHLAGSEVPQARACCERSLAIRREHVPEGVPYAAPAPFLRLLADVYAAAGDESAAAEVRRTHEARLSEEAALIGSLLEEQAAGRTETARARRPRIVPSPPAEDDDEDENEPPNHPTTQSPNHPITPDPGLSADALIPDLQNVFGHTAFTPGQREIIGRVLAGQDVLAILPTGGGKSLCYQLPALRAEGVVVVISPLIALMRDQWDNLPPELARVSAVINSSVDSSEIEAALYDIAAGRCRLIYAAPERLRQWPFVHALRRAGVAIFVVDEAHCISLWGHDFRPDYFFIGPALEALGQPRLLALTATASLQVQAEIGARLGRQLATVSAGVARPNLRLEVRPCGNDEEKLRRVLEIVPAERGAAIVYARARDRCEELARLLRRRGVSAIHYHAGMETPEREAAHTAFMSDQARVVCATVAFGMGIDKADIRLILHYNLPKSVENYWQEAGRAGRDGLPSRCLLLFTPGDRGQLTRWMRQEAVSIELLRDLYHAARGLLGGPGPGRILFDDLARAVGKEETEIRVALALLERVGLVQRFPDLPRTLSLCVTARGDAAFAEFVRRARLRPGQRLSLDALELCERAGAQPGTLEGQLLAWRDAGWLEARASGRDALLALPRAPEGARQHLESLLESYEARQEARVAEMVGYARSRRCRHVFIARVFGERARACGTMCDVCRPSPAADAPEPAARPEAAPALAVSPGMAALQVAGSLRFAVGRKGLVNILKGSVAAAVRLDECPLFGALQAWPRSTLERLVNRLTELGYLRRDDEGEFPVLRLTTVGRQALAAGDLPEDVRADLPTPARPASAPAPAAEPEPGPEFDAEDPAQQALFERLRAWRREMSVREGMPPYVIFHDSALRAIAAARPATLEALQAVPGIGPRKTERYGEAVLAVVRGAAGTG